MKNFSYYFLYKKTLKGKFDLKECMPAKEYIEKIMKQLEKEGMFDQFDGLGIYDDKEYIVTVMKNIIDLFKLLIAENKLDNIDQTLEFLFNIHVDGYGIGDYVKAIVFKGEKFAKEEDYYDCIKSFCHYVNLRYDGLCNDSRIAKTLDVYHSIHSLLPDGSFNTPEWNNQIFFERYAPYIVGHFYKTDLDTKVLEAILEKFYDNVSILREKCIMNGICDLNLFRSSDGYQVEIDFSKLIFDDKAYQKKDIK